TGACVENAAASDDAPDATVVESWNDASDELARPESASDAMQATDSLVADQLAGDGAHETLGATGSICRPVTGPAAAQLPTTSHTVRASVAAVAVATPLGTAVVSVNLVSAALARPEPASDAVHPTVTLPVCQPDGG